MPFPLPYLGLAGRDLPTHGLFFLLGALLARQLARHKLSPGDFRVLDNAIPFMVLASLIGARLAFLISRPDLWGQDWWKFWQGGMVSYGGLLGALIALCVPLVRSTKDAGAVLDSLTPCLLAGWGVGRIGCFLNWIGEEGTRSQAPWAVMVDGLTYHPVTLYMSALCLLGAALFWRPTHGTAAKGLCYFAITRWFTDFFRDYEPNYLRTASQLTCLALLVIGILLLTRKRVRTPLVELLPKERESWTKTN